MSRLIDADSLIERMKYTWDMQELYLPVHFIDLIEDEPTITFDEIVQQRAKDIEQKRREDMWND